MRTVLYLSYDGVTDPLGQAQVLPYLEGLAAEGYDIHLVSCEKPERAGGRSEIVGRLREVGISWHPLRYSKRPPILSTVWDLAWMRSSALRLHRRHGFDLVHCRSYIPALVGLELRRRAGVRFLFDMRGFWPDEKVDAGSWKLSNPLYLAVHRFFKRREEALLREADAVVSLTHAGMRSLAPTLDARGLPAGRRRVIPCSVDFSLFTLPDRPAIANARRALGVPEDALVLTYLGSLGTWYMLPEMLDFFAAVRRLEPDARFVFITPDSPETILDSAAARGIPADSLVIRSASRSEVATLLPATDVGVFFIRSTPSKVSSSPTKLGEFLALGIPVVTGPGIGDVEDNLRQTAAGVVLEGFDEDAYTGAAARLDELRRVDRAEIRDRARQIFDLRRAVSQYRETYEELLDGHPARSR